MKRNPNRPKDAKAYGAVRDAILRGDITVPDMCSRCNSANRPCRGGRRYLQAHHHKGYDFPLDVEWLCPKCHRKETPLPSGERNGAAKLNSELVQAARRLHEDGSTYTEIAQILQVDRRTISRAINGVHWLAARNQTTK